MDWNQNGVKSKWTKIGMKNENQNKLFTLTMEIKIVMNFIAINMFTLV